MPTIVQAVLNENVSRSESPSVPLTPEAVAEDIRASVGAGASLVHFHARGADGRQIPNDEDYYRTAISASAVEREVLWYPPQSFAASAPARWTHVAPLMETVGLDIITIDPSSFDLMTVRDGEVQVPKIADMDADDSDDGPAMSPLEQWIWFCEEARRLGIKPMFGVLEPGALRRVVTWVELGLVEPPLLVNFFLTETYHFGLPADRASLDVYRRMVPSDIPVEWFCCPIGVRGEVARDLNEYAVAEGGHLRVGVGALPVDAPDPAATNADLVADAVALVDRAGGQVATPEQARTVLGAPIVHSAASAT